MNILKGKKEEKIFISTNGLKEIIQRKIDPQYPSKGVSWTDDFRCELPIKVGLEGISAEKPQTLIDGFRKSVVVNAKKPALSVKRNGKWETLSFAQYFEQCLIFGRALISLGMQEFTSVNIIGFNAPQWAISFFGSMFARCLPTGIYTTNTQASCEYVATHSDCRVVIAENFELARKYLNLLDNGQIRVIVLYDDRNYKVEPKYERRIFHWSEFMMEGHRVELRNIEERMDKVKPGNCCTLVYTSGTTGMPKGVMLSQDNYTWTKKSMDTQQDRSKDPPIKIVSYLPLSHVAGQFSDIVNPMLEGGHVYFADPTALTGSLVNTLQQVRPTVFFSVPRVWEKIYDKMQQVAKSNGALKTHIATWAKGLGPEGTIQEINDRQTSFCFKVAQKVIFNNVKKAIGLDQCKYFFYGAAPLDPKIRSYFLSLNFFLINTYGMSESSGPQNFSDKESFDYKDMNYLREVGKPLPGTQQKIVKVSSNDEEGEICYRGRNVFMGYYKNPAETDKAIDSDGFLHSGDNGRFDKNGVLFITGRAKQLIITAGGQNIPPLLIEQQIISELPFVSQVMVVGEQRKFLTCLIAIKESEPGSGLIESGAQNFLSNKGENIKTVPEAMNSRIVKRLISEGLKRANDKAISRAQVVQDFEIMPEEFSVNNGLLTPTMKLKRKEAAKHYKALIERLYQKPKL